MTSTEKRLYIRNLYRTIIGRNKYSQPKRDYCYKPYSDGKYYSDCSSSISHTYEECGLGFGILNTVGMYESSKLKKVDVPIENGIPQDVTKLRIGDMFLFAGTDNSRPECVGHVEMVGEIDGTNVTLYGHGSGTPSKKNMVTYCKQRQNTKTSTKRKNKGLIKVVRFIQDDDEIYEISGTIDVSGTWYLRSDPDKNGVAIGTVTSSKKVYYLGYERDGWYSVKVDGVVGWISKRAGTVVPATANIAIGKGTWYVRSGPDKSAKSLGTVKEGTSLPYQGEEKDGWYLVIFENQNGWVSKKAGVIQ